MNILDTEWADITVDDETLELATRVIGLGSPVRFKDSGKWYCTESVEWKTYDEFSKGGKSIDHAFAEALVHHLTGEKGKVRLQGMTAVCLDPWHEHTHPQMMKVSRAIEIIERENY